MLYMEPERSREYLSPILRNTERLKINRRYIGHDKDRKSDAKSKQRTTQPM